MHGLLLLLIAHASASESPVGSTLRCVTLVREGELDFPLRPPARPAVVGRAVGDAEPAACARLTYLAFRRANVNRNHVTTDRS